MQTIQDLFSNRVLLSGLIGWGAAQVLKTIIYALMHHTLDLTRIFGDGGMPSGHSATVCAVATSAGIIYGLDSFPFAISVIVAIIVMHDAMGVRLETGKQAKLRVHRPVCQAGAAAVRSGKAQGAGRPHAAAGLHGRPARHSDRRSVQSRRMSEAASPSTSSCKL